jgi:8-oxo-dGTP diphosphatase
VLLFRFRNIQKIPACSSYWATPVGEIEEGETAKQAAKRELYEETGLNINTNSLGNPIWHNEFVFRIDTGEEVAAYETFFVVYVSNPDISCANWTRQEAEVISE